jgi:hypothetical protein
MLALSPVSASAATTLKKGSRGTEVKELQSTLKELGYFTYPKATGYYGSITEAAVKRFQKDNGIPVVGKLDQTTRDILFGNMEGESDQKISLLSMESTPTIKYFGSLDWFKEVRNIWKRGMDATVTDVDTGVSFQVKRTYGTNHADVEPLTIEDTKVIKEIWGGFSWTRRAVIVQVGEYMLAASMTAMPHAGVDKAPAGKYVSNRSQGFGRGANLDAVKNNGANGVMDLHFKNSRTHTTNIKQKSMQDNVIKAAEYLKMIYIKE